VAPAAILPPLSTTAPSVTLTRRLFSPSRTTTVSVTGASPSASKTNVCSPRSTGSGVPSSFSATARPSTLTRTALRSAPDRSFASSTTVGCSCSSASSCRVQSSRTRAGHCGSPHTASMARASAKLPSRRRDCALVFASTHCALVTSAAAGGEAKAMSAAIDSVGTIL
jgi:hypothetical protein